MSKTASLLRYLALAATALGVLLADIAAVQAQSSSCRRLDATIEQIERSAEYRGLSQNTQSARGLQRELQRTESSYIRGGCNADARAGRPLNAQCRSLASSIISGRDQLERLLAAVERGNAVARQREDLQRERARFGCGSSARVIREERRPANIFERLFGSFGEPVGNESIREEQFDPWGNYHTVRTLCVRKSDGFYWPISYSTLVDYVVNDAEQCRAMCPGLDVDLFYYDNPGQEPEQAINLNGEAYASLPNAFKFRTEVDETATCKAEVAYGSIVIVDRPEGDRRAMIQFGEESFPLPIRDPRRQATQIVEASLEDQNFVDIPLPRRRPAAPGEEPRPQPVAAAADTSLRVVTFGDKRVRIVGPMTPYAQAGAAGS